MKKTIEQVEHQFEEKLNTPLKSLLQELDYPSTNSRVRVSLRDSKGTKKRSNASAENWSPQSGCLQIWFEAGSDELSERTLVKPEATTGSQHKALGTTDLPNEVSVDPIVDLVRALDRAELKPGWDFVALKKFRDEALVTENFKWVDSDVKRQGVLRDAIEKRYVLVSKVPNPKSPQFPVTAIRLNRLMPEVQRILGKQADLGLDFVPVEIRGDTLSATILRERR